MGDRDYDPSEIDPGVLPLVDLLNDVPSFRTYISCEGHDGERVFSRTPYVCFWLKMEQTEKGQFFFKGEALHQLGKLAWVLSRTYEDGFHLMPPDWEHRYLPPVATVRICGQDPFNSADEVPDSWAPVAFCLDVRAKEFLPLIVNTLKKEWSLDRH